MATDPTTITMEEFFAALAQETSITDATKIMTRKGTDDVKYTEKSDIGNGPPFNIFLGGNAYTGTGIIKLQLPFAMTVTSVVLGAGIAPTGSSLTYDINYHATDPDSATTIFSSNPSIAATAHTGSSSSLSVTSLAQNGWVVIDCDAIGSTLPGTGITISIRQD